MIIGALVGLTCVAGDFVVRGNAMTDIQKAIDAAAESGGGRVVVPAGEYRGASVRLRSRIELHLEKGARLVGSIRSDDYFDFPDEVCTVAPEGSRKVFVYAWDAHDLAITGAGVIDGQGPEFFDRDAPLMWDYFWPKPSVPRPRMVQFVNCRGIRLAGVTFRDSPGWTMLIRNCEDVAVDGIRIDANPKIINSDGIDFDCCRNVRVGNSAFRTGDDCLIMRAMREKPGDHAVCENVVVSNCTLESMCQTVRIGCPSDDTIRNVTFRNIRAKGRNGIYFDYPVHYLRPDDEGYMDVSDVTFDGYEGEFFGSALQIVVGPEVDIRTVRDVVFRNVKVKSARPLRFVGNRDSVLRNVSLENVTAEVVGEKPYLVAAVDPLRLRNCTFNGVKADDADLVVPGEARTPLVRVNGSWEAAKEKKK